MQSGLLEEACDIGQRVCGGFRQGFIIQADKFAYGEGRLFDMLGIRSFKQSWDRLDRFISHMGEQKRLFADKHAKVSLPGSWHLRIVPKAGGTMVETFIDATTMFQHMEKRAQRCLQQLSLLDLASSPAIDAWTVLRCSGVPPGCDLAGRSSASGCPASAFSQGEPNMRPNESA